MGDAGDAGAEVWVETVGEVPVTWRRNAAMSDFRGIGDGACGVHVC